MIVEKRVIQNLFSESHDSVDPSVNDIVMRPTGEGKECVAQKRREELTADARDLAAKVTR